MDRLLVVDSDKQNVKTITEGLSKSGHFEVLVAFDSKTAVHLINNNSISVLISGLHLPDFDGVELLAHMTRAFPSTPCIAMLDPGQPKPWFIEQTTHRNTLEFIEKPIAFDNLISLINICIQLKNKGITEKGMTLKNFLPLIETAKKSCQMEVKSGKKNKGLLFFFRGSLIDARCENKIGDAAVTEMIEWDSVKISISRLPANKKEIPIGIPLMNKLGVSWEKKSPVVQTVAAIEPIPLPEGPPPDPAVIAKLDAALKKYSGVLKTIKGYLGLAVLSPGGNVLASDFTGAPIDFKSFSPEFSAILNQCRMAADQKNFNKCTAVTVHTEKGVIIMIPADAGQFGSYLFIGLMSPEGNGFFMQVQLEKIIPQILKL